jgi:hypothetical protein
MGKPRLAPVRSDAVAAAAAAAEQKRLSERRAALRYQLLVEHPLMPSGSYSTDSFSEKRKAR